MKFFFKLRRDLANNYLSVTHTHYQPYRNNDGLEELPSKVAGQTSAFTQTAYNHNPRPKDVLDTFIDTRINAPFDVLPNHKARLHQIKNKDPIASENFNHVIFILIKKFKSKLIGLTYFQLIRDQVT